MSIAATAISAGAALLGSGAQMVSTGKLNKKNRQWQEDMWQKTNEYNSPAMQMQRYKDAGLNPHLIYGQGNNGNASMASAPNQEQVDYQKGSAQFGDAIMSYVAQRKQQAEIDNLKKASDVMDADIIKKRAETQSTLSSSAKTDLEVKQASELWQTTKETAEANLTNKNIESEKLRTDIQNTLKDMQVKDKTMHVSDAQIQQISQNIQESANRIKLMKIDGDNKAIELEINKAKKKMWDKGVNPESSAGQRVLKELYEASGLSSIIQGHKNWRDTRVDYFKQGDKPLVDYFKIAPWKQ